MGSQSFVTRCDHFNFSDDLFESHYYDVEDPQNERIITFLTCLALCHTVNVGPGDQAFNASSPDELALV
jgi:magnesium-transporting ATPase (P-type)